MDFLLDALTNWLKEMLVGGIMGNLTGMFDSVNQQVADIATQVGQTPQGWNGSIFSMIQNLSNTIMVPIAGVILAIVMTLELIQMILPEQLQSPLLTADWEYRLGEIERGELAPEDFMDGICAMLKELVGTYQVIKGSEYLFTPPREVVGKCPRCGGEVAETQKGFFCQEKSCKFAIWKNSKWWAAKRKQPTKTIVAALLKDGRAHVTGLYSEKSGKTYDATVVLEDTGQYVNFKLDFDRQKGGGK